MGFILWWIKELPFRLVAGLSIIFCFATVSVVNIFRWLLRYIENRLLADNIDFTVQYYRLIITKTDLFRRFNANIYLLFFSS